MLALARGIMSNPKIILIDEPSVGLSPISLGHLMERIKELKQCLKLTVLMTEQNIKQAIRIADRGYIIVERKIEFDGGNIDDLKKHELIKKVYLGM